MTEIWDRIGDSFEDALPQLIGAAIILLLGWVVAWLASNAVKKLLHRTSIDNVVGRWLGARDISATEAAAANLTFWTVMLLALIAALEALSLDTVTRPLNDVVSDVLGVLPRVFAALLIMIAGYVVARIVRTVISNFAAAVGVDRLGTRAGFSRPDTTAPAPSEALGLVAFTLVLIPTLVAALSALDLPEVARPVGNMLDQILAALPDILAATLLMVISYLVARVLQQLTTSILAGTGLDTLPSRLGAPAPAAGRPTPSQMAGYLLFVAILVTSAMEAARLLGFLALATLIQEFISFAGSVLLGLIVIGIGLWLARLTATSIRASQVERAELLARAAQTVVIFLAISIGLGEMGIAREIVILAFALPLGALSAGLAIGLGVAFGLGGRPVATRLADRLAGTIGGTRSDTA